MTFADVESARKAYWSKLKKGLPIVIIPAAIEIPLLIATFFSFGSFASSGGSATMFTAITAGVASIAGAIILFFIIAKPRAAYHKAYKAYFVEQTLRKTFTDLTYDHQKGLSAYLLSATGMINIGDDYSSNDLTIAKYKNTGFTQSDVHIQTVSTDSDGNTTYTTIFKGRVMIFEFPKKFDFKLELIGKKFRAYRVPGKDQSTGRKMVKIDTESTEFNQTFKIFGQDGFETFYILDPAMIVRIQAIAEHYKDKVLLGFYDNKMLVALDDGKDSFEPPRPSKPIDEKAETDKVASDIKVITDFVDVIS
ncbi:DUF3137 domain-containing protein [Candidatus Saccharibacteria bacterium]|nr:DUF3137 domain-containing protein [Candidatus Saccharibacteria bacterium]